MSIIPTKREVLDEIEQFNHDYGDGVEFYDTLAEYVIQVAEEASNSHGQIGPMVAHPHDVLLAVYDAVNGTEVGDPQAVAKTIFKHLDEQFAFISKES